MLDLSHYSKKFQADSYSLKRSLLDDNNAQPNTKPVIQKESCWIYHTKVKKSPLIENYFEIPSTFYNLEGSIFTYLTGNKF